MSKKAYIQPEFELLRVTALESFLDLAASGDGETLVDGNEGAGDGTVTDDGVWG